MELIKKMILVLLLLGNTLLMQAQIAKDAYDKSLELYNKGFPSHSLYLLISVDKVNLDVLNKKELADFYRLAAKSALLAGDAKKFENYSEESLKPHPVYIESTSKGELAEYQNIINQFEYLPKWTVGINAQLNKYILKAHNSFGYKKANPGFSLNYMIDAAYWFSRYFGLETNAYVNSKDKYFSYLINLELVYRKPIKKDFQFLAGFGWGIAKISCLNINEWNCVFPFTKYENNTNNYFPYGTTFNYSKNNDIIIGGKIGFNYRYKETKRKYSEWIFNFSCSFYSSLYFNSYSQEAWDKALRYNTVMSQNQKEYAFVYAYPQYLMINMGIIKPLDYKIFKKK